MTAEEAAFLSKPVDDGVENSFFTFVTPGIPGVLFSYTSSKTIVNVADIINGWNINAMNCIQPFILYITTATASDDGETSIHMYNSSPEFQYLFAESFGYLGSWGGYESKVIDIDSISRRQTSFTLSRTPPTAPSPIVVLQDRPVFNMTAYIYKKKDSGFYMINETFTIRTGFYDTLTTFIAFLNMNITMRGQRNGFIYQFIHGKTPGTIGIEAAHRQPEPSFLLIEPLSDVLGTQMGNNLTLKLRTSKREFFDGVVASTIL